LDAPSKILATENDFTNAIANVRDELASLEYEVSKKIRNSVKWMFFFWITQIAATFAIFYFFLKK
jgi:hypothetical protein